MNRELLKEKAFQLAKKLFKKLDTSEVGTLKANNINIDFLPVDYLLVLSPLLITMELQYEYLSEQIFCKIFVEYFLDLSHQ